MKMDQNQQHKQQSILKLFACFPSMATAGETQVAAMLAAYLETLSNFSSEIVAGACSALRKKSNPFPSSSGEIFTECEKRQLSARKAAEWERLGRPVVKFPTLAPPSKHDWTLAELANWECVVNGNGGPYTMRVGENGSALKIPPTYPGAGHPAEYGYLTPREAENARELKARQVAPAYRRAAE